MSKYHVCVQSERRWHASHTACQDEVSLMFTGAEMTGNSFNLRHYCRLCSPCVILLFQSLSVSLMCTDVGFVQTLALMGWLEVLIMG